VRALGIVELPPRFDFPSGISESEKPLLANTDLLSSSLDKEGRSLLGVAQREPRCTLIIKSRFLRV
jgi:hypothetical protein